MSISITEKKIKSKIKTGETVAVIENIKYPYFECDDKKHRKLCDRMNGFYSSVAEKYSSHARNKLPKKIKLSRLTCKLPMVLTMTYTIALCDERIISVVTDLTFTQGKSVKTRRFSQMWGMKSGGLLPVSEIIKTDRASKKKIYSLVVSAAKENDDTGAFGYFGDYLIRLSKNFDINNCFAVPKGICFFINAGILSPIKYGVGSFIMATGKIKELIKGDFLPKEGEKEAERADIVNNV